MNSLSQTLFKKYLQENEIILTEKNIEKIFCFFDEQKDVLCFDEDIKDFDNENKTLTKEEKKQIIKNLIESPIIDIQNNVLEKDIVQKTLEQLKGEKLINDKTGIKAIINKNQINKMFSKVATNKSKINGFSIKEHYAVLNEIRTLFKKAQIIVSRNDRNNDVNILSIKNFIVPFKTKINKGYASMLMKETKEHGNRIYTLELQELMNIEKMLEEYF